MVRRLYRLPLDRLVVLVWTIAGLAVAEAALPAIGPLMPAPVCRLLLDPHDKFTRVVPAATSGPLVARQTISTIAVNYTGFSSQAQTAFQAAVDIWQTQVGSTPPIVVNATFRDLNSTSILGQAGFTNAYATSLRANTWFPVPIANRIAGVDWNGSVPEITAQFNSAFNWYYGTDGVTPSGRVDFVSVVLHELGHGLGFAGSATISNGAGYVGAVYPYIYDVPVVDASGVSILDAAAYPNGSAALESMLTSAAFWDGANGRSANGGVRPKLYTPPTYASGSTYSHLDEATYAAGTIDSLMTPALGYAEAIHVPGPITSGMLADMGWGSTCSLGLDRASQTVAASASTSLKLAVSAGATCGWSATTAAGFVHLTSGTSATGPGVLRFAVDANPGTSQRQATVTVSASGFADTQTFTIVQAGTCSYSLDAASASVAAAGASVSIGVTAAAGCAWTASAPTGSFASLTSASAGTGNGSVTVSVPTYSGSSARVTTLTIAGLAFVITQQTPCAYVLGSTSASIPSAGGFADVVVTATPGCAWTASTASTFVTVSGGTSTVNGVVNASGSATVRVIAAANPSVAVRNAVVTIAGQAFTVTQNGIATPLMDLDRRMLIFGARMSAAGFDAQTPAQTVHLTQTGTSAVVSWTATPSVPWITVTPAAGVSSGAITIAVQPHVTLPLDGSTFGTVALAFTNASTPAATITVRLNTSTRTTGPVGSLDTPVSGSARLQGSIVVSGWALDDLGVARVEIWRDRQPGETTPPFASVPGDPRAGKIFIADATFVDGARPDVEALYGAAPVAYRAGWGYLLLTQGLWNGGNGTYTLYAYGFDRESHVALLGQTAIGVDNQAANRPFGTIDTPGIGTTLAGSVISAGWALTPPVGGQATCTIASTGVQMSIDSGPLMPVTFGAARPDVAAAFPGFANAAGSGGTSIVDTTELANGVHTIGWLVTDSCNRSDGIGSRFFTVNNGSLTVLPRAAGADPLSLHLLSHDAVVASRGYGELGERVDADWLGERVFAIEQGQRAELRLPGGFESAWQIVDGERRALPVGASWDPASQTFAWQPGAAFLGSYPLVFTAADSDLRIRVDVIARR